MQTDIFLRYKEQALIIDTKYYGHTMQMQYDKATLHSGDVYQIFTYIKNQDANTGNVSDMLLYAKTEEAITPDCSFVMGGKAVPRYILNMRLQLQKFCWRKVFAKKDIENKKE